MDIIFSHCAGLAVHKKRITACRVTPDLTGHQADGILEGCVANFAQEVMKGQLPLSMWRLCGQGVELFGGSKPLVSFHLPFLDHVHELDTNQRILGCRKRLEPEHGTRDPFHRSMVLFHKVIEVLDLADVDRGAVFLVIALDGGFIGVTAVNGNLLRHTVAANCLLQKP
jgi:hypothetical protein